MSDALPPLLFRSEGLVVLDKPAGLPVHPGPRGGASVEDWFPLLSRRRAGPWLVHRLDADTAGCLAVALRRAALLEAQALFARGAVRKVYWAVVEGEPAADFGTIDAPLAKRSKPGSWRMVVDPEGQPARTSWRVLGRSGGRAWLELSPETGRTHQIRVHCAALGCPLVGDAVYGAAGVDRLHLLARSLSLPMAALVQAEAPPPPHMVPTLRALGWAPPRPNPAGT
ncbi:MAG: RNA pseudouridine synthase [Acetobacteraceae bacterium]|nr:RNA pseudouridine synthase [Acetobacteraceae bacterium]